MDYAKDMTSLSPVELVVLAVLVALCVVVAWQMYRKFTGRAGSDVSGLHLKKNGHTPD